MKKYTLTLFLLILFFNATGQIIKNKLDLDVSIGAQNYIGNSNYRTNLSYQPLLIGRSFSTGNLQIDVNYKLNRILDAGFGVQTSLPNSWSYEGDLNILKVKDFRSSHLQFNLVVNSPLRLFKRIDLALVFSPSLNHLNAHTTLSYHDLLIIDEIGNLTEWEKKINLNDMFWGSSLGLNVKIPVNTFYGYFIQAGYNRLFLNHSYFHESTLQSYYLRFGVTIRLMFNKRFHY